MTDNEIVKALECCGNQMHSCSDRQCKAKTMGNAVELITRQKAEIERLEDYNENLLAANVGLSCDLLDEIQRARAEAIKEFAERLKDIVDEPALIRGRVIDVIIEKIDNLVKEMTEETKHD